MVEMWFTSDTYPSKLKIIIVVFDEAEFKEKLQT